jgi:hypothetical protein
MAAVRLSHDVVRIAGGGLGKKSIAIDIEKAGDKEFVSISRNHSWKLFLGNNYSVVDFLLKERERLCDAEMKKHCTDLDPLVSLDEQPMPKKSRRGCYDKLTIEYVTVKFNAGDGGEEHTIHVRKAPSMNVPLEIEPTECALEALLLEMPQDGPVKLPKDFLKDFPNVNWAVSRNGLYCRWADLATGQWKVKTVGVKSGPGFVDRVRVAAASLVTFRGQYHNVAYSYIVTKEEDADAATSNSNESD